MAWSDAARAAALASRRAHMHGSKKTGMQRFHKERYRDFVKYHGKVGSRPYSKVKVRDPFGKVHTVYHQRGTHLSTSGGGLHITKAFYPGRSR